MESFSPVGSLFLGQGALDLLQDRWEVPQNAPERADPGAAASGPASLQRPGAAETGAALAVLHPCTSQWVLHPFGASTTALSGGAVERTLKEKCCRDGAAGMALQRWRCREGAVGMVLQGWRCRDGAAGTVRQGRCFEDGAAGTVVADRRCCLTVRH